MSPESELEKFTRRVKNLPLSSKPVEESKLEKYTRLVVGLPADNVMSCDTEEVQNGIKQLTDIDPKYAKRCLKALYNNFVTFLPGSEKSTARYVSAVGETLAELANAPKAWTKNGKEVR